MKLDKNLLQRYTNAKDVTTQWRSLLDEAYYFIQSNRNLWDQNSTTVNTPGEKKNRDVYDNTAALSARSLVSKLHSVLTPPFKRWGSLVSGSKIQNKDQLDQILYSANDVLYSYLHQSSVDVAISEAYSDLIFGTGCIKIDEGPDNSPLQFSAVPTHNAYFEEDSKGRIRSVWRDYEPLALRQIRANWPDATIPENIISMSSGNEEAKYDVFEGTIYDEEKDKYSYKVILCKDNEVILEDDEMDSSPWIVFRWSRLPGDVLGRGPAIEMLPTIRSLNKMVEYLVMGTAFSVYPPMFGYSDGVFNPSNARVEPGTIITISNMSASRPPLQPLNIQPNLSYAEMMIEGYRNDIRQAFLVNPFNMPQKTPEQTATEVTLKQEAFVEEVGPSFGRFEVEFLTPLIKRCVYILKKKGLFPPIELDGKEVSIKYESPLIQSQNDEDIMAFTKAYQTLAGVFTPQMAIGTVNIPEVVPWIAEKSGTDPSLFRDSDQIKRLAAQVNQVVGQQLPQAQPQAQQIPELAGQPQQ